MKIRTIFAGTCVAIALAGTAVAHAGRPAAPKALMAVASANALSGVTLPDSKLARDAVQAIRSAESELLVQHSMRVYYWAVLAGKRGGQTFDPDLLFVAAMFHDYGLTTGYGESHQRYEVDGADAARDFLRNHSVSEVEAQKIWLAIALHTTNGISPHLDPIASLLAAAANMDLVGAGFNDFTPAQRHAVEAAYPREPRFADDFMQALFDSLKHRPETTQGTGLADVMAYKDPKFPLRNFSRLMLDAPWGTPR